MRCFPLAASIVLLAGSTTAFAQPMVDGQKDILYGPAKWVQTQPTTFGDNRANICTSIGSKIAFSYNNDNGGGVTGGSTVFDNTPTSTDPNYLAALLVTTGFEARIPLSQLGNPTGNIRLAGFINNSGGDYFSNQFIGGFAFAPGATVNNLGGSHDLSDTSIAPGNQFITIPSNAGTNCTSAAPLIDGTLDAFYGSPLWVQNVQTGFGDPGYHDPNYNDGSEIDAVYAKICRVDLGTGDGLQDYLFLFVAGNLQGGNNYSGNHLSLFFDTGAAGGQNVIGGTLPPAGGLGGTNGMTFDAGFSANYFMSFADGYVDALGGPRLQAAFAKLGTGAAGGIIGITSSTTEGLGTGTLCPPDQILAIGSELDGLYSYVDHATNNLYLMFTGNLKQNDYLTLFFDVNGNPTGDEGQHTINGVSSATIFGQRRNVTIGLATGGNLNRCGYDSPTAPGLTFDTGFAADYFLNTHIESTTRHVIDAAVLRTGGRAEAANGVPLDYGSYQGADIPTLLAWDGTNFDQPYPGSIQPQDGFTTDLYSHYPPRESSRVLQGYRDQNGNAFPPSNNMDGTNPVWSDWLGATNNGNPVAPLALRPRSGLIQGRIDNSNVAGVVGVTDAPGGNGASAVSGFEMRISLNELGYNPRSRIRVAGFIAHDGFNVVSNQVLGDPVGLVDLGDPRNIDFSAIPGNQYVVVSSCAADFNGDGVVNVTDIFNFLTAWFAQAGQSGPGHSADINGDGVVNVTDIFNYLTLWFQGQCIGG